MKPRDRARALVLAGDCQVRAERSAEGEAPRLPRFSGVAYTGAPMKPQGWKEPIIIDLDGVKVPSQHRPVLRQHDPEKVAGHTTSVRSTKDGLLVDGVFSGEDRHAESVTVPASRGFRWQLSVGANPTKTEYLEAGQSATVNGREVHGPLTVSRETEIGEISFVPLGADQDTLVSVHAQANTGGKSMDPWKVALRALVAEVRAGTTRVAAGCKTSYTDAEIDNMSADEARRTFKRFMKTARAEGKEDDSDEEDDMDSDDMDKEKSESEQLVSLKAEAARVMDGLRASAAREHQRHADIAGRAARHGVTLAEVEVQGRRRKVDLVAHAIAEGWTADQTELVALRCARPAGPVGGLGCTTTRPDATEAVLEAAVLQAGGCELFDSDFFTRTSGERGPVPARLKTRFEREIKARYTDDVQQQAHTLFRGRIRLQQLLTTVAAQNGYRGSDSIRDDDSLQSVAHHCTVRAEGPSNASLANILANVLNKFLLQGYLFTEQSWREIAGIRAVVDFKPTRAINLFGNFQFEKVGEGGELKNATLQDQAFANQADQTGKIITIGRKSIINDDLSALTGVPVLMGRGAGLYLNDLLWSTFLNPGKDDGGSTNFFAATHTIQGQVGNSNLSTGTGSALSSAGLTAAVLLYDNQVDPMGYPLGIEPEILLYPPDLESTARELMNAQYIVYGGASAARQPNTNVWQGRFRPVKSRYLNKTVYTGNSTTAWYLVANPGVIATIEVAFLNGVDVPSVLQAGPDFQFNLLGISIRGTFDVGVTMQNFRAAVKSAGV